MTVSALLLAAATTAVQNRTWFGYAIAVEAVLVAIAYFFMRKNVGEAKWTPVE
ncbi:MAG: hypothetical protein M3Y64_07070 [Gemmatimonadota bacterium]|nr:hypothetical protein [Gemmatimonadota bacterium]